MARRKKSLNSSASFWSRLLPESIQIYIARRLHDGWSMLLLGAGLFLSLALVTYHPADPSLNSATVQDTQATEIQNLFGYAGSFAADFMVQSFGIAAIIPGLALLLWGLRTFRRQEQAPLSGRLLWVFLATFLLSVGAARVPGPGVLPGTYMGGGIGAVSLKMLTTPFAGWFGGWEYSMIAGLSALAGAICLLRGLEIPFSSVRAVILKSGQIAFAWLKTVYFACRALIEWVQHHNDEEYSNKSWKVVKDQIEDTLASVSRGPDEHAPRPRPKPKTKQTEQTQARKSASDIQVVAPKSADRKEAGVKQGALSFARDTVSDWELPPVDFLQKPDGKNKTHSPDEAAFRRNAEMLESVLEDFNVSGEVVKIHPGPVVTLYEFEPAPGTKTARVVNLSDDIARSMAAVSVRVAVIPGRNVIGIELPNETRQTVYLRELLDTRDYEKTKAKLPLVLGKDIGGAPVIADLARMPHLLVAGTTGSGKSVAINTMLMSLLYRLPPEQCRLLMIDPKMLELSVYDDIPHLLSPVVTEPGKAVVALKWVVQEMENRYRAMSKLGVRNIEGYNARLAEARKKGEALIRKVQTGFDPETGKPTYEDQALDLTSLPYIVVVVDEFADLMLVAGKDVENAIQRLAQMARAAGIHLIMATQRPSVDVITGVVKANFPTRISFHVTSKIDSRTIIGEGGAEQLLGMGDMLYMTPGGRLTRVHGPFVTDSEVEDVVSFLKSQGDPSYLEDITDEEGSFGDSEIMNAMFGDGGGGSDDKVDELYDEAVAIVARERKASTSFIQRHLQIGYNRAARMIDEMEKQGVIGPANHVGKREVLVSDFSDA